MKSKLKQEIDDIRDCKVDKTEYIRNSTRTSRDVKNLEISFKNFDEKLTTAVFKCIDRKVDSVIYDFENDIPNAEHTSLIRFFNMMYYQLLKETKVKNKMKNSISDLQFCFDDL